MVELEGISIEFPGFSLKEVCLEVPREEYFMLFGPTGSGKSVMLEIIAGLRRPSGGRVRINGRDVTFTDPALRRVGYVPQDLALIPFLTVRQNVAFGLRSAAFRPPGRNSREETEKRTGEILEMLGIGHLAGRLPGLLSGGEKQRVALGRALAVRPDVLLLDEPLSALDGKTAGVLMRELKSLQCTVGITTIHVCHRLEEVFCMGDRLAVIADGEIIRAGAPAEVYENPVDVRAAELFSEGVFVPGCRGEKAARGVKPSG